MDDGFEDLDSLSGWFNTQITNKIKSVLRTWKEAVKRLLRFLEERLTRVWERSCKRDSSSSGDVRVAVVVMLTSLAFAFAIKKSKPQKMALFVCCPSTRKSVPAV